ncbi:unnamed protein product [Lactuca saligna]|uniref:Uncharacterized protein n=1 Tax=Lactuca saligna TaxID=75948 RepID=A0AA35Y3J9_LACSI|nr:unnamed protein product [Lactuca saligna]
MFSAWIFLLRSGSEGSLLWPLIKMLEILKPFSLLVHQPEDAIEKFFNGGRCEGRHSTVLRSSPVVGSKEDQGEDPPVLIFVGLRRRNTIGIRNREALPLIHRFEGGG